MATSFTSPLICPVLIGRTSHLEALVQFMEQARSGHRQAVLIAGEAGIGKSRLLSEAAARLSSSNSPSSPAGVLTLVGRCFEQDAALPYAPLLDLLRTFFAKRGPETLAASLAPMAPDFVNLLPELAAFLPDAVSDLAADPDQEKRRLYQSLLQLFAHLSATRALLLIIEDLHWSDETSLDFLLYLVRHISSQPILLLLTYRSDEVHAGLARFLAALDRERLTPELRLSRLSNNEVGTMINSILALRRQVDANVLTIIVNGAQAEPLSERLVLRRFDAQKSHYAGSISPGVARMRIRPTHNPDDLPANGQHVNRMIVWMQQSRLAWR